MFKASVPRLEWSEMDVLCMCIICISVCSPNCCCMSASHKSTWGFYSSYSYRSCSFAFLFLILRLLCTYTTSKIESCAPLRIAWRNRLTTLVCLFVPLVFSLLPQLCLSFPSVFLFVCLLSYTSFFVAFLSSFLLCPVLFFHYKLYLQDNKDKFVYVWIVMFQTVLYFYETRFRTQKKGLKSTGARKQVLWRVYVPKRNEVVWQLGPYGSGNLESRTFHSILIYW